MSQYLEYQKLLIKSGKTDRYLVVNKTNCVPLGLIKWHGAFRKFAFFPYPDLVFDPSCLRDIADRLIALMTNYREEKKTLN